VFSIAALARTRKARRIPRQIYPKALERDYAKFLRSLRGIIEKEYAPIIARMPNEIARLKIDAEETDLEKLIKIAEQNLKETLDPSRLKPFLERATARAETWVSGQLAKQTKAAVGVDIIGSNPYQMKRAEAFVQANVQLIKGITEGTTQRLNNTLMRAVQNGSNYQDLAKDLQKDFSFTEDKAKFIARDQMGKLYGQVNADQQKGLGIKQFIWRTSGDERVRDEHKALDGITFSYDDLPDEGLPGDPILCRCHAEPVFDFLTEE